MKSLSKIIFFALLVAAIVLLLNRQFERLPHVVHDHSSSQPQAAAQQLLQHWQKKPRRLTSSTELFPLPDHSTVIILERQNGRLADWQQQQLIDWIESGGRLITHALPLDNDQYYDGDISAEDISGHDPLLYHFGISAWQHSEIAARPALPLAGEMGNTLLVYNFQRHCINPASSDNHCADLTCGDDSLEISYAWLADDQSAGLQLDLEPRIDLFHRDLFNRIEEDDPTVPASDSTVMLRGNNEQHDLLLQLDAGMGQLWVLTGLDIFNNERLHHLDHAALLQLLTADQQQVWWVHSINVPPLEQWLWQRAWPLISALLLLLLIFLWRHIPRQGVMLADTSTLHRDFTEHLRAAGALLWRLDQRRALLQPLRQAVLTNLAKHAGGSEPAQREALAAQLSGLTLAQVQRALAEVPASDIAVQELVALLQQLRRCT